MLQDTSPYVIQLLNSIGDHLDLKTVLDPLAGINLHESTVELEEDIVRNGHCSALVKVQYG